MVFLEFDSATEQLRTSLTSPGVGAPPGSPLLTSQMPLSSAGPLANSNNSKVSLMVRHPLRIGCYTP